MIKIHRFFNFNYQDGDSYTSYKVNVDGEDKNLIQLFKFGRQQYFHLYKLGIDGSPVSNFEYTPLDIREAKNIIASSLV